MADGFSFKLDLDTTKFVAELDRAKLQAQSLGNSFANANKAAADSIGTMKSAYAQLIAAGKGSSDEALKLRDNIKAASAEADKLAKAATQVDKEFSKVGDGGALDGLIGKFKEGQKSASEGGGMFGSLAGKLGELATPVGAATAAFAALSAGLFETVNAGKEFEQNTAALSAITGVTGDGLTDLADRAKDLALKFGGSATEQLKSFQGILSRFGPDLANTPEALTKVSESINVLAKAGGISAAEAMDSLTNSMLQFGVDTSNASELADESAHFINVLAASAKVGAAEIPQVAEALLQVGATAHGLGISIEETNAALQGLALGGKVGSEAGVGLRNVLTSLVKEGGKEQVKIIEDMGLSYQKLGKVLTTEGLAPALEMLKGGLQKLGGAQEQAGALASLFGKENLAAAQALIGHTKEIKDFTKGVTGTSEAYTQAAVNMNTFSGRLDRLKAALEDVLLKGFKLISPIINGFIDNLGSIIKVVAPLVVAFGAYTLAMNAAAIAKGVFSVASGVARVAMLAFNAVLAANPIGLLIAGLAAAVAAYAIFHKSSQDVAQSQLESAEAQQHLIETQIQDNEAKQKGAQATLGLVERFKQLAGQSSLTKKEQDELTSIQRKLDAQYPNLIDLTKSYKDNLNGVAEIGKITTDSLDGLVKKNTELQGQLAESVKLISFSKRNVAVEELQSSFDKLDFSTLEKGFGITFSKASVDAKKVFDELQKRDFRTRIFTANDESALDKLNSEMLEFFNAQAVNIKDSKVFLEIQEGITKAIEAQKQALIAGGAIKKEQDKDQKKPVAPVIPPPDSTDPDKKEKGKSAFQRATDEAKDLQKATDTALEKFKEDQQKVLLAEHRSELSNAEKRDLLEEQIRLQEIQAQKTEELFKKDGKINIKLDASKGESEADVNKTISDVQKKILPLKIQLQTSVDSAASKSFQTSINELADSLKDSATIDITAQFNQKEFVEDFLRKRASVEAQIDEIKIKLGAGQISEDDADKAISVLTKALDKADKDFQKTQAQATKAVTDARLAGMTDEVEKEKIIKIDKLISERDKELSNVLLTEQQRLAITARYQAEIDALRGKANPVAKDDYADAIIKSFDDIFKAESELADKQKAENKTKQSALEKELADIEHQNKSKLLSYDEYAEKRAAIEAEMHKLSSKEESKFHVAGRAALLTANKEISKELDKVAKDQNKNFEEQSAKGTFAFASLAEGAAASFGSMIAQGANAGEALKEVAKNTATLLVNSYAPAIIGLFTATIPPPFGQILGGLAVVGIKALLSAAISGFREGGYTGDRGVGDIAGVVHGKEFVHTADVTARNRPLFEHLHKGGDLSSWMVSPAGQLMNEQRHVSRLMSTGQMSASISMSGVESRLDRVEKAVLKGNKKFESMQNVQMTVTHDPSLILKSQSRRLEVKQARY